MLCITFGFETVTGTVTDRARAPGWKADLVDALDQESGAHPVGLPVPRHTRWATVARRGRVGMLVTGLRGYVERY